MMPAMARMQTILITFSLPFDDADGTSINFNEKWNENENTMCVVDLNEYSNIQYIQIDKSYE